MTSFVNEPPVYKPVIQFLNQLAHFKLCKVKSFRNQAERFESWPNGLEAGWMVYEQLNGMKAVQACQTSSPWARWHESWPNYFWSIQAI